MAKSKKQSSYKLSNDDVRKLSNATIYPFPKYVTSFINLASNTAQATRPKVVGKLSDFIQEFDGQSLEEWIAWYDEKKPEAIDDATDKAYDMLDKMRKASMKIDKKMVKEWVKDLVYNKTYCGLKVQSAILSYVAGIVKQGWRLATAEEESKNIDGYIGGLAVQIKPVTYKNEKHLGYAIDVPIIYYKKTKGGFNIEFEGEAFKELGLSIIKE